MISKFDNGSQSSEPTRMLSLARTFVAWRHKLDVVEDSNLSFDSQLSWICQPYAYKGSFLRVCATHTVSNQ